MMQSEEERRRHLEQGRKLLEERNKQLGTVGYNTPPSSTVPISRLPYSPLSEPTNYTSTFTSPLPTYLSNNNNNNYTPTMPRNMYPFSSTTPTPITNNNSPLTQYSPYSPQVMGLSTDNMKKTTPPLPTIPNTYDIHSASPSLPFSLPQPFSYDPKTPLYNSPSPTPSFVSPSSSLPSSPLPPSSSSSSSSNNQHYNDEHLQLQILSTKLNEEKRSNEELLSKLTNQQRINEDLTNQINTAMQKASMMEDLTAGNAQLQTHLKELQDAKNGEIEKLKAEASSHLHDNQILRDANSRLSDEIANLTSQISILQNAANSSIGGSEEISLLTKNFEEQTKRHQERIQELEGQIAQQNEVNKQTLKELKDIKDVHQMTLKEKEQQIAILCKESDQRDKENQALRTSTFQLNENIKKYQQEIFLEKKHTSQLQTEIETLKQQLQHLQPRLKSSEALSSSQLKEIEQLKTKLTTSESLNRQLTLENHNLKTTPNPILINNNANNNIANSASSSSSSSQPGGVREKNDVAVGELQKQMENLRLENQKLRGEVSQYNEIVQQLQLNLSDLISAYEALLLQKNQLEIDLTSRNSEIHRLNEIIQSNQFLLSANVAEDLQHFSKSEEGERSTPVIDYSAVIELRQKHSKFEWSNPNVSIEELQEQKIHQLLEEISLFENLFHHFKLSHSPPSTTNINNNNNNNSSSSNVVGGDDDDARCHRQVAVSSPSLGVDSIVKSDEYKKVLGELENERSKVRSLSEDISKLETVIETGDLTLYIQLKEKQNNELLAQLQCFEKQNHHHSSNNNGSGSGSGDLRNIVGVVANGSASKVGNGGAADSTMVVGEALAVKNNQQTKVTTPNPATQKKKGWFSIW